MLCHDIQEKFSAYIDGMLDASDASRVEDHIASCAECRMEYDDLRAAVEMVRDLPEVIPPPEFNNSLRERMRGYVGAEKFENKIMAEQTTRRLFHGRWFGALAAAAVIFLVVGVTALWQDVNGGLFMVPGFKQEVASDFGAGQKQKEKDNDSSMQIAAKSRETQLSGEQVPGEGYAGSTGSISEEAPSAGGYGEMPTVRERRSDDETRQNEEPVENGDPVSIAGAPRQDSAQPSESKPPGGAVIMQEPEATDMGFSITSTPEEEAAAKAAPPGHGGGPAPEGVQSPGFLQVTEYAVTLYVSDREDAVQKIRDTTTRYGGLVEGQKGKSEIALRVPVSAAEPLLNELSRIGKVEGKQVKKEDLVSEIQHLEKKLGELMSREEALSGLPGEEADEASQQELDALRTELSGVREELAALNEKTAIATINVEIRKAN